MTEDEYIDQLIDAGATDEEIVELLAEFRQRSSSSSPTPTQPASQTPPSPPSNETDGGTFLEGVAAGATAGVSAINRGISTLAVSPIKVLGAVEETLGRAVGAMGHGDGYLTTAAKGIENFVEDINPRREDVSQTAQDVFEGFGQVGGMMASGGMSGTTGLVQTATKVPGMLPTLGKALTRRPAVLGGTMTAAPEWEQAKAAGLDDIDAFEVMAKNYLVGNTNAITLQRAMGRIARIFGGEAKNKLISFVAASGKGGVEEALQEGFETYLTNMIAQEDYDPDRDPMFQVLQSAEVGGIVGMFLPMIGSAMTTASPKVKQKLLEKIAVLEANKSVGETQSGDPVVDGAISKQTDQITQVLSDLSSQNVNAPTGDLGAAPTLTPETNEIIEKVNRGEEITQEELDLIEPKPITPTEPIKLTETTIPVRDKELNDTGKTKKAIQFEIGLEGVGTAEGTIVGNKASISEINAEQDEKGDAKKGGGLYQKVIDLLRGKGITQITVGMQSPASTAALQSLIKKGVLSVAKDSEIDISDNPTRFNIENDLVNDFDQTGALLGMTEESKTETRAVASEQIADFLRGKVKTRGEVVNFQDSWNQKHPERPITDSEALEAWNRVKPVPIDKGPVITKPINELLKDQIKTFYRGMEKGVRRGQKLVNENLIPKVQEALKAAKLTPRQTSAILTKLKASNLFTPGSQSKLGAFIDKVVNDAQYADKLAKSRSLQKRVRKFARQKSGDNVVGNKILARSFGKINPSNVENLDEYIDRANSIIGAFLPVNNPKYGPVNHQETEDYIEKVREKEETSQEEELIDDEIGKDEERVEQLRAIAKSSAERLAEKDLSNFDARSKESIETIKKLNIDEIADEASLKRYIKTIDNIVENDDLSNEADIEALAAAQDMMRRWEDYVKTRKIKPVTVGLWSRVMDNVSNMWKKIYNNDEFEAFIREYYQDLAKAGAEREKRFYDFDLALDEKIKELAKKYKKTDVRALDNQIHFEVYYLLKQMVDPSEMSKMHRNIKAVITRHTRSENAEEAKAWTDAHSKYESVTSEQELDAIIEKEAPALKELWDFFRSRFTDEMAQEQARVTREVHNREYKPVKNYLPIVQHSVNTLYRRLQKMDDGSQVHTKSINPQQARTAMRRTLNLMDQHSVYTSTPINDILLRYSETVYDNLAAKEEKKLLALLRHPKLRELVGGKENEAAIIKAFDRFLAIQRGIHGTQTDSEVEEFFTESAKAFRHIGTIRALASFSQMFKQSTVTFKTWVNLITTGDADLMVPAVHAVTTMKKGDEHPVQKLLANSTLVARSLRLGGTDRGTSEAYKLQRGARRWFLRWAEKRRVKLDKRVRRNLSLLVKPDLFNARVAYLSYYMKSLRDQGYRNDIDLNTEWQKKDQPERRKAIAYAETMVEKTQTASNAALLSEFQAKAASNWGEFVKTIFVPFSTFDADFKARFVNEVQAVRRSKSSNDLVKLGGTVGEAMTFALMSGVAVYFWQSVIKKVIEAVTGVEPPEKDKEDTVEFLGVELSKKQMRQRVAGSVSNSINPLAIGTIPQDIQASALNQLGYWLDSQDDPELTKKEWMKKNAWVFEGKEGKIYENLGVYSSGLSPLVELLKESPKTLSILGEPVTVVDAYGNSKEIRMTDDQQKILALKLLVEFSTLSGITEADVANAVRKIYREQLLHAPAVKSESRSGNERKFKRKERNFNRVNE